jgi:hypothetical protein
MAIAAFVLAALAIVCAVRLTEKGPGDADAEFELRAASADHRRRLTEIERRLRDDVLCRGDAVKLDRKPQDDDESFVD